MDAHKVELRLLKSSIIILYVPYVLKDTNFSAISLASQDK